MLVGKQRVAAIQRALGRSFAGGPLQLGTEKLVHSLPMRRDKALDTAATRAKGGHEASVRSLVEVALRYPHAFEIPALFRLAIEGKLAQAELAHRTHHRYVTEHHLATLINSLIKPFHLPECLETSPEQVHVVRMSAEWRSPVFMQKGMACEMSPLQTVHVAAVLLDNKIVNASFQVPPAQWEQSLVQNTLEYMDVIRSRQSAPMTPRVRVPSLAPELTAQGREIRTAIGLMFASLSVGDVLALSVNVRRKRQTRKW